MEILKAKGRDFEFKGKRIHLRGYGIGTWLNIEHFMIGLPTSERTIKNTIGGVCGEEIRDRFFEKFVDGFISDKDFVFLKNCGINCVRVPINYRLFVNDNNIEQYKEEGFAYLERLLDLCEKYEMFALIDLHAVPGGQNPDWHSDNDLGIPLFWQYQMFRKQTSKLWGKIAKRLRKYTYLMGYDLLNEPAMADWDLLNEFYEDTINTIREEDDQHMIILEGDHFSMDFSGLRKFEDSNIAIGFHYYPTVWHPDLLSNKISRDQRKQRIEDGLIRLINLKDEFDCPIFCGEFGYGKDCGEKEFTRKLLEDTLDIFKKYQLDWFLWSYKDANFMSIVYPQSCSKWLRLTKVIESKWTQDIEKHQANKILDFIKDNYFINMSDDEKYLLQFRIRSILYFLQSRYIIKPAIDNINGTELINMAKDFKFEKCDIYSEMKELISRYT